MGGLKVHHLGCPPHLDIGALLRLIRIPVGAAPKPPVAAVPGWDFGRAKSCQEDWIWLTSAGWSMTHPKTIHPAVLPMTCFSSVSGFCNLDPSALSTNAR